MRKFIIPEIQEGDLVIFGEKRFIYKGDEEGFQRVEKEKVYQKVEREECPTEGCTNPKQAMGTCFGCNSKNI